MNKREIIKAVDEAKKFVSAAHEALDELANDKCYIVGTAKSGKLRRASLDLTRALAEMRKPS